MGRARARALILGTAALALCLVLVVACGSLAACGGAQNRLQAGETVQGRVTRIDGDTLQIALGTTEDGEFRRTSDVIMVDLAKATIASDAGERLTSADIATDDVLTLTAGGDGATDITVSRDPESVAAEQGTAATDLAEAKRLVGQRLTGDGEDESVVRVTAPDVVLVDCRIEQAGAPTDASKARLFGLGSALLVTHGGRLTADGGSVTSSAEGAAGLFAYGENSLAMLNKTEVTTTKSSAPAAVASARGALESNGATLTTSGVASPAIRTTADGSATLASGELVTNGLDSATVEASARLSAEGAKLTAAHAEALVLSGGADASLADCSIASSMDRGRGTRAPLNVQSILVFGERSSAEESAKLALSGGSLTNNSGDLIFVTNVTADISLSGVRVQNADPEAALVRVSGNDGSLGWGEAGANGGAATLTATRQHLAGNLEVDRISQLSVHLTEGSSLEGAAAVEGSGDEAGTLDVVVDAGCTWKLTADSTVTTLENHGSVIFDGHTLTLADGSVLGG